MAKAALSEHKLWYVVRTNIKSEQKANDNLREAGFETYLPKRRVEKRRKRSHTYVTTEHPLMMRYLFLAMERGQEHFGFARACEGVERILGDIDHHPIRVPFSVVNAMFIAEINLEFDDTRAARKERGEIFETQFPQGAKVFIKELGSVLEGLSGDVIKTDGKRRVQIDLGTLGKAWIGRDSIERAA